MQSNTTIAKVLSTLRLLAHNGGRLCVSDMMQRLDVSSATAYRYLAELEGAGLVSRFAIGEYVLGPEIVALERAARDYDPYVVAAQPVMAALARGTGASVIFGRPCGRRLVYVLDVPGRLGPPGLTNMRGRSDSLQCGAMSEIMLASMSSGDQCDAEASLREQPGQTDTARSTSSPEAGARYLRGRKACCSVGEVDPDTVLWAVAILRGNQMVGSLGAAFRRQAPSPEPARMEDQMWRAALRIEGRLRAHVHDVQGDR